METVLTTEAAEVPAKELVTKELLEKLFYSKRLTFWDTLDPPEEGYWDAGFSWEPRR